MLKVVIKGSLINMSVMIFENWMDAFVDEALRVCKSHESRGPFNLHDHVRKWKKNSLEDHFKIETTILNGFLKSKMSF